MNKQQKEVQQAFLDNEKAVLKKLEENYKDALGEINSKIEILMARQDADMQHVIYQTEYQKALKTQVQSILENLQTNEFETVSEYLAQSYEDGFIGTMYDLQGQGIPLIFPIEQQQVVTAIQHETMLSVGLYASLGKDVKDLQKKIAGEISRGIATGAMYTEIARNISSWAQIPKNNAMRIARTEAHRIQCRATADAQFKAKEKGANVVKEWSSALDNRTRDSHRLLDGQIRELEEPFEVNGHKAMMPGGFGRPEEDINCRCALLQRARWALDAVQTRHLGKLDGMTDEELQPLADKLHISVDELRTYQDQIIPVKAKSYDDFKRQYKQISNYHGSDMEAEAKARIAGYKNGNGTERVREGVQKINTGNTLENIGKSSTIKAITVHDLIKATEGSRVKAEVANEIAAILERYGAASLFDTAMKANLGANIVFQTNPDKAGTFFDTVLEINEDKIGGMSIDEINQMFKGADNTICDSLEDAIVHEIYHARLISGMNYAQMENLYAELDEIHIEGLGKTAYKDGAECIAEVGVMVERGEKDNVPLAALELFERYMGVK